MSSLLMSVVHRLARVFFVFFSLLHVIVIVSSFNKKSSLPDQTAKPAGLGPLLHSNDVYTKSLQSGGGLAACSALPPVALLALGFSPAQVRRCQLYPDHMTSVARGIQLGIDECQYQLRWRRWNCIGVRVDTGTVSDTSFPGGGSGGGTIRPDGGGGGDEEEFLALNGSLFDGSIAIPVTKKGSRESAFVRAITSAGVLYAVSRACRDGQLVGCGCNGDHPEHRQQQQQQQQRPVAAGSKSRIARRHPAAAAAADWPWTGCGDNTEYGYRFGVGFSDAPDREKNFPRRSAELATLLANLHNNEAGRLAVLNETLVSCKCHGVSGSCSLKTCWHQLPEFRAVGDRLRLRYDDAVEACFNRHGTYLIHEVLQQQTPAAVTTDANRRRGRRQQQRQPTGSGRIPPEQLVFVDSSPDYCEVDSTYGWPGTHGRRCSVRRRSASSTGGDDWASEAARSSGCESLCCGRGYDSYRQAVSQRCRCRFQWCCSVQCDVCRQMENVHVCK